MGYSDIATFNTYFNINGLVTFNGPTIMAGFAESKQLEEDFIEHINNFLFDTCCYYISYGKINKTFHRTCTSQTMRWMQNRGHRSL